METGPVTTGPTGPGETRGTALRLLVALMALAAGAGAVVITATLIARTVA
jgi:hypothetical protein